MLVRQPIPNAISGTVQINAPAKVNLFLELLGKRADGYHELETVMTTVSLADSIYFEPNLSGEIKLKINRPSEVTSGEEDNSTDDISADDMSADDIPTDHRNLIVASLNLLKQQVSKADLGMNVVLEKRIPSAAGLGGASSDAAAAIRAGNEAWNLALTATQLHQAAEAIGSDVPFFLYGGTAICTGRGERVRTVDGPVGLPMVIAKPKVGLSTPAVFKACSIPDSPVSSKSFLQTLAAGSPSQIAGQMLNRLQSTATTLVEEIGHLSEAFSQTGCLGHQMSGSGTSYFGIFSSAAAARTAATALENLNSNWNIYSVQSLER